MPETMTPPAAPAATSQPAGGDAFESQLESSLGADLTPSPAPASPEPPKPTPAPAAAPVAAKPAEVKPAPKAAVKPVEKPAESKETPKEPKALREELERIRTEAAEYKKKNDEMAAEVKKGEALGKDMEALKARLEARDKEFEAVQGRLRAKEFEASPDFKKQYGDPLERALSDAQETIATMVKADQSQADFDRDVLPIFHQSKKNYGQAYASARELFGDDQAPAIMQHVTELRRLESVHNKALAAERANWQERAKQEEGRKVQEREQDAATWNKINEDLKNTVDDYRDPVDDTELATARANGQSLYDQQPQSKQEHWVKFAHIRHRLGAYEAQKLQIARLTAQLAERDATIEESKVRQPGEAPHKPGGDSVAAPEISWEDEARQIKGR